MANNNFFGIDDVPADETATATLFGEGLPDAESLKNVKEKEAEDKAAAEAKKADEAKKAEDAKKKPIPVAKTKEEVAAEEESIDAEETLFGTPAKKKEEAATKDDAEENEEEESEESEEEDNSEKSQFEILSESLYKAGVFQAEVDEDGEETIHVAKTPQEFKKLFEAQMEVGTYQKINSFLSRFGEDRQELFDAIFNKGVDPKEYLPVYNSIQSFENAQIDTEDGQEAVVREFYKRSGIPEDKINKKVQNLKDTAYLQEEAETFLPQLIQKDKEAAQKMKDDKEAAIKAEEFKDKQYQSSIAKILTEKIKAKEFDGIPLTEKRAQQAYDYLYNKKWQGPDNKKYTDFDKFFLELNKPENHSLKVKIGLLALDNFDLTKVKNKAVSDETNELFSEFTQKKTKKATKVKTATSTAWNNL